MEVMFLLLLVHGFVSSCTRLLKKLVYGIFMKFSESAVVVTKNNSINVGGDQLISAKTSQCPVKLGSICLSLAAVVSSTLLTMVRELNKMRVGDVQ